MLEVPRLDAKDESEEGDKEEGGERGGGGGGGERGAAHILTAIFQPLYDQHLAWRIRLAQEALLTSEEWAGK